MQKPFGFGAKIFQDSATAKVFYTLSNYFVDAYKAEFIEKVFALFEKKTLSKNGEYTVFKITKQDLENIYEAVHSNV